MPKVMPQKGPRQGDILIVPRDKANKFVGQPVPPVDGRVIIAEGEATGHHHYIEATPNVLLLDDGIDTVIAVGTGKEYMKHQEHTPVTILKGESDVIRQRHVVPASEHVIARTVFD